MSPVIKQVEEKNLANEIDILLWSDKMDLLALSNVKGEVALHRLSWSRAWSLGPPKEGLRVRGLAWRPDGKVLAIAYSSGEILLIDVENRNTLNKIEIEGNLTFISWTSETIKKDAEDDYHSSYVSNCELSSKYLLDLPHVSNVGSSSPLDENTNSNLFYDQKELSFLIMGTEGGHLHLSIFGQFPCGFLKLKDITGYSCSVMSAFLSEKLDFLFVTVKDNSNLVKLLVFRSRVFKTRRKELFVTALKHGHINSLITYLSNTILPIKETWETILLEMDEKLAKFAARVPDEGLSADFLDLLMFGMVSDELHDFLVRDITEKGLKRFGQVTEMCYGNIQKLLLKHVMKAGQNIVFHLVELRGLARWDCKFEVCGLSEDTITESIAAGGAFLAKAGEMLEIIDRYMINYKAFFRWLYSAIVGLMQSNFLSEMPKPTEQDVASITEFVLNFDDVGSSHRSGKFIMERLGQYLNDSPLTLPSNKNSHWESFLERDKNVEQQSCIIKRYKNYSFIQQFKHLVLSMENIFAKTQDLIVERLKLITQRNCLNLTGEHLIVSKMNVNKSSMLIIFLDRSSPAGGIYFIEISYEKDIYGKGCHFYFEQSPGNNYLVADAVFYSTNIISVLLQANNSDQAGLFYQLPIANWQEKLVCLRNCSGDSLQDIVKINGLDLELGASKVIDGMAPSKFSVSGRRRVSVVLSKNRKKVRLFEMEVEEDEEDDAEMTSGVREGDTSMQEDISVVE